MAKDKRIFNLLKPIKPPMSVWDKIYLWILGRARIVVIVAELLVVVAFFSKVVVDTVAKNKTEQVKSLQTEVSFYSEGKEAEFRKVIAKDQNYSLLWSKSSKMTSVLDEILSYIPNPASEVTINIEKDKVSILGKIDLQSLEQIEQLIENSPTFETAYIDTLSIESQDARQNQGNYVLVAIVAEDKQLRENLTLQLE